MPATPKTASFVGLQPPGQLPMQQLGLDQAQLISALQNMQEQGYGRPLINTGEVRVPEFGGLAQALVARQTKQEIENNQKKMADLQGSYQAGLAQQLKAFRDATGENPDAYKAFLDDPYPEVRERAGAIDASRQKLAEKLVERAGLGSVQAAPDNFRQWAPKETYTPLEGAFFRQQEGAPPTLAPSTAVTQTKLPSGAVVNQFASGKQDTVERGTTISPRFNIGVETGTKLVDKKIDNLPADREKAMSYFNTIRSTEQALNALANGARAGYGEDFLQSARTLISGLTGTQFDSTTPTAVLAKALSENIVSEFGGKLGTGVSNADVQFMQKAMGGTETDPKAIERILAIRAAAALRRIKDYQSSVEALADVPGNTLGPAATRKMYSVETPKYDFKFKTPEARASFRSGLNNVPFEEELKVEPGAGGGDESAIRERMKALNLPYTPPPKGGR